MTRYDIAYLLLCILSMPLWPRYLTQSRYRRLIRQRLFPKQNQDPKPSLWLHAVSVGEVNSLLSLIEDLAQKYPRHQIILTVSTPSGYQHAQDKAPACKILPAPLDFSFSIKRFISHNRPQLIVLNELEIWPNWLTIAKKQKIPIILINARLSDKAFSRYLFFRRFSKAMLDRVDRILCQSEHHRQRFMQLGIPAEHILSSGHIKADEAVRQVSMLGSPNVLTKALSIHSSKRTILFASCHAEDEAVFFPLLNNLQRENQIIIAPRHLNRIKKISDALKTMQVHHRLWSEHTGAGREDDVIVFDRMGKLLQLMMAADLVVMGGTFSAKTGGHNMFEPLACHRLVLGGPNSENFPDITRDLIAQKLYLQFSTAAELQNLLREQPPPVSDIKTKAEHILDRYCGANQTILREIEKCLPS